ncbi:hypothetical protein H2199_004163 [Coniosporium tulheliwenetii]|uniref:Uncharacterized protein n=1 Tax=Coniosporium tulheliwenetii TaxID=3383036 RepID=A0ACC2Z716_9PEZI|nr:hypothetical protein H2199_004163 [Cladosporium sp. JES 115]
MANDISIAQAQTILGYQFNNVAYLREALHAAGSGFIKDGQQILHEGNKRLAVLGNAVIQLILQQDWYGSGRSRESGNQNLSRIAASQFLADVARQSGIDLCIVPNPSQHGQPASPVLLTSTISAAIGAIWLDSANNLPVTRRVMINLRILQ